MVLNCNYTSLRWTNFKTEKYTCWATVVPTAYGNVVDSVSINHLRGKNDSDVQGLLIQYQKVEFFPGNIESFFPNLITLSLYQSKLKKITGNDLMPFPKLLRINFYGNLIEELPSNLFQNNPNIQDIIFGHNSIRHIGPNVFSPLDNLMYAEFYENPCIDMEANNKEAIVELLYKISVYCPPTLEMYEEALTNSDNFKSGFDEMIDEKLAVIQTKIDELLGVERDERRIDVETLRLQGEEFAKALGNEVKPAKREDNDGQISGEASEMSRETSEKNTRES